MATGAQYEVVGGRELRKTIRDAAGDLADLKRAHRQAAEIAARASADLAPVRTGRLARTVRASGTNTAGIIRAGNNTRVPYGSPIHWGWFKRGIKPQPFLSEGARDSEGRWVRIYEEVVQTALDTVQGA